MSQPWFRFYSEALRDRKLEYACRMTGQPKVIIVGMWTTLLALANDSPDRGALVIAEGFPVTTADIVRDTELSQDAVVTILEAFERLGMAAKFEGVLVVCNWDKRQFASDDVTSRVQKSRAKRKAKAASNVTETLPERSEQQDSNTPDTEQTIADQATTETVEAEAAPPEAYAIPVNLDGWIALLRDLPPKTNQPAILRAMGQAMYPARDPPSFSRFGQVAKQVGGAERLAHLLWQSEGYRVTGDYLAYCTQLAKGIAKDGPQAKMDRQLDMIANWRPAT